MMFLLSCLLFPLVRRDSKLGLGFWVRAPADPPSPDLEGSSGGNRPSGGGGREGCEADSVDAAGQGGGGGRLRQVGAGATAAMAR